jgi:hypothetical protein
LIGFNAQNARVSNQRSELTIGEIVYRESLQRRLVYVLERAFVQFGETAR